MFQVGALCVCLPGSDGCVWRIFMVVGFFPPLFWRAADVVMFSREYKLDWWRLAARHLKEQKKSSIQEEEPVGICTINRQEAKKVVRAVNTSSQCNFHKRMFLPVIFPFFFFFPSLFFSFSPRIRKMSWQQKAVSRSEAKEKLKLSRGRRTLLGSWLLGLFLWSSC